MLVFYHIKNTHIQKNEDCLIIKLSIISFLQSTLAMIDAKRGRDFYIILQKKSDFKFL